MGGIERGQDQEGKVEQLTAALRELQSENDALRGELEAFDPEFFEEIEDLKHEHYVLS